MPLRPGYCPACERFIGPLDACPFCDCPAERQAGLRLLRALAVALALAGLALLALAAARRETPRVGIGAITPAMNFARVRVEGAVAAPPRAGRTRAGEPWFGLTLEDHGRRLRVSAYGDAAPALPAAGLATGAWVQAEGRLSIRAGQPPTLYLDRPEDLRTGAAP